MSNEKFKELLKKAELTKKSFAELLNIKSQVVNNWSNSDRSVPYWVDSWLTLYIENKEYNELKQIIKDNICKD